MILKTSWVLFSLTTIHQILRAVFFLVFSRRIGFDIIGIGDDALRKQFGNSQKPFDHFLTALGLRQLIMMLLANQKLSHSKSRKG